MGNGLTHLLAAILALASVLARLYPGHIPRVRPRSSSAAASACPSGVPGSWLDSLSIPRSFTAVLPIARLAYSFK